MIEILKKIPFFAALSDEDLTAIAKTVTMDYLPQGHTVFKEGDAGDRMYIIKRGQAQVIRGGATLAELNDNDFFGEMALVSDVPRNAEVKITADTEVMVLKKEDFVKLITTNPRIAEMVSFEVVKRAGNL